MYAFLLLLVQVTQTTQTTQTNSHNMEAGLTCHATTKYQVEPAVGSGNWLENENENTNSCMEAQGVRNSN